jgi:hypothetical protein
MTGVRWTERFAGRLGFEAATDYNDALLENVGQDATMMMHVSYDDVERWIRDSSYPGRVEGGTLTCDGLSGGTATVEGGRFEILVPANGRLSDSLHLRMRYEMALRHDATGEPLTLHGFKLIENNPGFDCWTDTTTLFTSIFRGAEVPADADDGGLLAIGVLHINLVSFARQMLGFRGASGSWSDRFGAALRYQTWFGRRLLRAYAGAPVTQSRPSFPVDRPQPDWDVPPAELDWHDVAGTDRLQRKVIPFAVEDLDFPLNVQRLRLAGGGEPDGEPVLLIPGSGVRANMFYGQPGHGSLAEYLLALGYDVWVENWRASIDLPPNSYTLDDAARFDHPAAIDVVLEQTGRTDGKLRTVVHCQGSVGFLMAYVAGYLDGKVSHVVSSAVSLFPEVRWDTWLKQRVARPMVDLTTPWMDAQWGLRSDTPIGSLFGVLARYTERPCGNPPCQVANFMYGSGWDTLLLHKDAEGRDWLDPDVHEWSARELGATPMSFIDQICESSRYGHIVPAQPRDPAWPSNYLAVPEPLAAADQRAHFTFIAGDQNRMWRWQGQEKAARFMREFHECASCFVGLPGFGHLDSLWGREAPARVFPVIADGLAWDGRDPAPHQQAAGRGEDRTLTEGWPARHGRLTALARATARRDA